jgi:hypothetical protein
MTNISSSADVEQWGIFEVALEIVLEGSAAKNPFLDNQFTARFSQGSRAFEVNGFYDGEGIYRVRFMPDTTGTWQYQTSSNLEGLNGKEGRFEVVPAGPGNHGPVRVANTFHFAYADSTPFKQIGTTCYAWTHQGDALEEQTLATLKTAPFNKMRMCVFPKHYAFNENEPEYYPFPLLSKGSSKWEGNWDKDKSISGWSFDYSRFEPAFFQHLEQRIGDLLELGIEADLILFHPYDRWGFSTMSAEEDDRYLRYVVARLAAYRNIWWSMANEFDFMHQKSDSDWDRFFHVVQENDPYQHLRSIHNGSKFYDHSKPWVTHQSVQHSDLALVSQWREEHRKPVVVDECCYEGNLWQFWGNITGEEMVLRFWEGTVRAGYVGHGDTFYDPEDIIWWAKGGVLKGHSASRLEFLRKILEDGPAEGLEPQTDLIQGRRPAVAGKAHEYYLIYFGQHQPAFMTVTLPEDEKYRAEVLDTWEMTVTPLDEQFSGAVTIPMPVVKPYQALVLKRIP